MTFARIFYILILAFCVSQTKGQDFGDGVKRSLSFPNCSSTLCVTKSTLSSSVRIFQAVFGGQGSILLFFKLIEPESGIQLTSPYPIHRGPHGEPYLFVQLDEVNNKINLLYASIITSSSWTLPKYSWAYASLFSSICLDNNDVCLEEILSTDCRVRTITAVNYRYIEQSVQFKVTGNSNTKFVLWDKTTFADQAVSVIPRRISGQDPVRVFLLTAYQHIPSEGWWFSFQFYGRRGDYRVVSDGYLYDPPFVGTYIVNQGFSGKFSHTGWENYSVDWDLPLQTEVYSARDGVVCMIKQDQYLSKFDPGVCPQPVTESCNTPYSDGNTVIVRHDDGTWGLYTHLSHNGVIVNEGDVISGKTLLAYSGDTGYSAGPHLHFQLTKASAFNNTNKWIVETIPWQNINLQGQAFVPETGKAFSAARQYQPQPPQYRPAPSVLITPPLVSPSYVKVALNQEAPPYSGSETLVDIWTYFISLFCLLLCAL